MAGETLSSQAIYDSKTKTLYLEDILVPFINELTGKISRKKGIFDAELKENPSIIDGKIFKNFAITNNRYDVNTDFDAICKQTFGNNYLQADWEELKKT
ncbi:hypothetical protein, partial [Candidatus Marithrix sp. Canyon 246]|uniref:hypothetical protein n=1 Tax=Candidatus Marithrix sp. Canyon 246 TaxID=1827136 RepID=UPI00114C8F46